MYEMLRCVYKRQGRGVCYAKRRKNLMCCSVTIHHHPPVLSNTITSDNAHTLLHFCAAIKWHYTLFQSVCCLFKDGFVNFDVSMFWCVNQLFSYAASSAHSLAFLKHSKKLRIDPWGQQPAIHVNIEYNTTKYCWYSFWIFEIFGSYNSGVQNQFKDDCTKCIPYAFGQKLHLWF